eukprot:gnl/Hemi2/19036_TR6303_c0_g1_i1.p1 gnl/Hemi2/19036_TR6303_c0_g1~~gnl/Hemi2/19036_TR6303_c0_g1_i1.p1  ORF type:complete len:140 (+),score=6.99 gnl/Hemi2/19036_TR6303_c0_g1_i1:100-519(+)
MFNLSDWKQIGLYMTGAGVVFLIFGVLLFLDKGLLAMGNILFVAGVTLLIGPMRAFNFFFRRSWRGCLTFFIGIFVVLIKWAYIEKIMTLGGMCLELYGVFILFGDFIPVIMTYIPFLGMLRYIPVINKLIPEQRTCTV